MRTPPGSSMVVPATGGPACSSDCGMIGLAGLGGQAKRHELEIGDGRLRLGVTRQLTQLLLPVVVRGLRDAFAEAELGDGHLRGRKSPQPFPPKVGGFGFGHGFSPLGETIQTHYPKTRAYNGSGVRLRF